MSLLATLSLLIVSIASLAYFYVKWAYKYWQRKKVPYIEPTFPFGSKCTPPVPMCVSFKVFYDHFKSNGHRFGGLYFMMSPIVIWTDVELVKNVLAKDFHHFVNRGIQINEKHDPLSAHLFNLEGANWKKMRVKLTPTFTSGKMKMMFQILVDCSENLLVKIGELADDQVTLFEDSKLW